MLNKGSCKPLLNIFTWETISTISVCSLPPEVCDEPEAEKHECEKLFVLFCQRERDKNISASLFLPSLIQRDGLSLTTFIITETHRLPFIFIWVSEQPGKKQHICQTAECLELLEKCKQKKDGIRFGFVTSRLWERNQTNSSLSL